VITLNSGQIEAWLTQLLWPFIRIGACLMSAPVFGGSYVSPRIRILLALAIAILVAPLLPTAPAVTAFSVPGFVITAQQLIIGVALGFAVQVVFDAVTLGGQLLANSMGLGFAFNVDPVHGASTPVVGQLYSAMVMLTFLALNGHLMLIEVLVRGFATLPVGTTGLGADGLWTLVQWGSQLFLGALTVALPGMTAMLIVNVAFGVMSRAAPTLNLFAVGFPITLAFGLVIILLGLPKAQSGFIELMNQTWGLLGTLTSASPAAQLPGR
jgi:flagellar biosynthetic protein FliR